jgi:hypothetical protein
MKALFSITFAAAWLHSAALAQTTFVNLDFEAASFVSTVPHPFYGNIQASSAFPGWTVLNGAGPTPWAWSNAVTYTPFASASLFSTAGNVIAGQYSITMFSGALSSNGTFVASDLALTQTGLVPAGSQSLRLAVRGDVFNVSLGGTSLPLIPLSRATNNFLAYTVWGADITGHANLSEELRITVPYDGVLLTGHYHSIVLDSIFFSPNPIPEPRVWSLLGLGALALVLFKVRRNRGRRIAPTIPIPARSDRRA